MHYGISSQNWVNGKYNTFIAIGMYTPNGIDLSDDYDIVPIFNIIDYLK